MQLGMPIGRTLKKAQWQRLITPKKLVLPEGQVKKLTAVDELVLEILGKDSPNAVGLHVVDTLAEDIEVQPGTSANITLPDEIEVRDEQTVENPESKTRKRKTIVMEGSLRYKELQEINNLTKKKLELEIENMKLQNYNLQLEIYKKEKEFNIKSQYSLYTETPENEDVLLITDTCQINEDGTVELQQ